MRARRRHRRCQRDGAHPQRRERAARTVAELGEEPARLLQRELRVVEASIRLGVLRPGERLVGAALGGVIAEVAGGRAQPALVRRADRPDEAIVAELVPAGSGPPFAPDEAPLLEHVDDGVRHARGAVGRPDDCAARSHVRDEVLADPVAQHALVHAARHRGGLHGVGIEACEDLVDVAELAHMVVRDHVDAGRQLAPQAVADELQLHGLDELALELDRFGAAEVLARAAQLADQPLRDPRCERLALGGDRAARRLERRLGAEALEPEAPRFGKDRQVGIERGKVVLAQREHHAQPRVALDRRGELLEEARAVLPALGVNEHDLLELVEDDTRGSGRPPRRCAVGGREVLAEGRVVAVLGRAPRTPARARGRLAGCGLHRRLPVRQRVGDEDIGAARRAGAALGDRAPHARRREHLEARLALERGDEPGVQQRALAGTRWRMQQHDRIRDDERQELAHLGLATEEQPLLSPLEGPRTHERRRARLRLRRRGAHRGGA